MERFSSVLKIVSALVMVLMLAGTDGFATATIPTADTPGGI
jgi:hypothetical protein